METRGNRFRQVYIKLGTGCNLHCRYCHAEGRKIVFNPAILPVLKGLGLETVVFGGGEPFLYWDIMREIVSFLGDDVSYKVVTNGTLFTQEIVDFCNRYRFSIFLSLDGIGSTRDDSSPIRWDLVRRFRKTGTAVTFYRENSDLKNTLRSLDGYKKRYLTMPADIYSSFPNFIHSTDKTGLVSDDALVMSYISQMTEMLEEAMRLYKDGRSTAFLEASFMRFMKVKDYHGIACCNDRNFSVLADGTVCACPYTFEKVGSVFRLDAIDWDKVKKDYGRTECCSCELFGVCGNSCHINVTDDECRIMKAMHANMARLMREYGITYEELDKVVYG